LLHGDGPCAWPTPARRACRMVSQPLPLSADAVVALGRPPIPGPGEDRKGGVNTNVLAIGGHVHALVEGGPLPIELDYNLESVARSDFGSTLEGGFTAHPKRDPVTGESVALTYEGGRPTVRYVVVDAAGRAETRPTLPCRMGRWCTMWASLRTSSSFSTCRSPFNRNGFRGMSSLTSGMSSRPRASDSCRAMAILPA
jgi:hypothetical protein